jgi:hypothetical protein
MEASESYSDPRPQKMPVVIDARLTDRFVVARGCCNASSLNEDSDMRRPNAPTTHSIRAALEITVTWRPVTINGFGTLGAVHSSDNQADFVSNPA